ncbi:MAG: hypothetical protein WCM76_13145 [Bacteroidota bacterium]
MYKRRLGSAILFFTLLCGMLLFTRQQVWAQVESNGEDEEEQVYELPPMKGSFFTGGSLGVQLGTVTMIDLSPQFGYYPLEHISVGVGFTYEYIRDRRSYGTSTSGYTVNMYGGRAFTRLYLPFYDPIFAHGEIEYMMYNNPFDKKDIINVTSVLAGLGYRQRLGGHSAINLMVLWNFNENENSLYTNPIIRAGVDIGL